MADGGESVARLDRYAKGISRNIQRQHDFNDRPSWFDKKSHLFYESPPPREIRWMRSEWYCRGTGISQGGQHDADRTDVYRVRGVAAQAAGASAMTTSSMTR